MWSDTGFMNVFSPFVQTWYKIFFIDFLGVSNNWQVLFIGQLLNGNCIKLLCWIDQFMLWMQHLLHDEPGFKCIYVKLVLISSYPRNWTYIRINYLIVEIFHGHVAHLIKDTRYLYADCPPRFLKFQRWLLAYIHIAMDCHTCGLHFSYKDVSI